MKTILCSAVLFLTAFSVAQAAGQKGQPFKIPGECDPNLNGVNDEEERTHIKTVCGSRFAQNASDCRNIKYCVWAPGYTCTPKSPFIYCQNLREPQNDRDCGCVRDR